MAFIYFQVHNLLYRIFAKQSNLHVKPDRITHLCGIFITLALGNGKLMSRALNKIIEANKINKSRKLNA